MDEQRALLDQLMGRERNVPLASRTGRGRHFSDDDVCKFFLAGLCPYVLFSNTKSDLGEHPNREEDNEDLKEEYDKLSEDEKRKYGYDRALLEYLEELVTACDRKVERNKARVDAENADGGLDDKVQQLVKLDQQIREKTAESEKLAEEGEVDEAQELLNQVELLRREKMNIEKSATSKAVKRNVVCEVSGNIMSSSDNEERIRCHFEGKQYLGWKACRDMLKDLREKLGVAGRSRPSGPPSSRGSYGGVDRQRSTRGSRSRSRSRGRNDRYRNGGGGGGGGGGRDYYSGGGGGGYRNRSRSRERRGSSRDRRDSRDRGSYYRR